MRNLKESMKMLTVRSIHNQIPPDWLGGSHIMHYCCGYCKTEGTVRVLYSLLEDFWVCSYHFLFLQDQVGNDINAIVHLLHVRGQWPMKLKSKMCN